MVAVGVTSVLENCDFKAKSVTCIHAVHDYLLSRLQLPFEVHVYYIQHIMMLVIPLFLLRLGGKKRLSLYVWALRTLQTFGFSTYYSKLEIQMFGVPTVYFLCQLFDWSPCLLQRIPYPILFSTWLLLFLVMFSLVCLSFPSLYATSFHRGKLGGNDVYAV